MVENGRVEFHSALDDFNRENGPDGPHMTRQGSSTIFDASVCKGPLGRFSSEFDASKFLVESRNLSKRDMPALVRAMWSTAKTTVVDPAQAAESRLVEATRRADKAGPPTPSPPFGSPPPLVVFAPAWLVVRIMSFALCRPSQMRKLRTRG
jgi:hypothetical protein